MVTYKLTCRWFRLPLSRLVAHVAHITDKPEPSVAPIVNHLTVCCAVCNGHCSVGWSNWFPAVDYNILNVVYILYCQNVIHLILRHNISISVCTDTAMTLTALLH